MPKANDKDAYYFSHDCNARNDDKILALRSVHGLEGYAIYFMIIEILREQPTYKLPISKYTYNTLAMQMQSTCTTVELIVNDCCTEFVNENSALLTISDGFLYSQSLIRRMNKVDLTSESRSKAANIRWEKEKLNKCNANAMQMQCNKKRIDDIKQDDIKQDDIKQKENKELKDIVVKNKKTYVEIVDYLNLVCKTNFKATSKATTNLIDTRLKEGFVLDDFKLAIDKKHLEWGEKSEMVQYLRPLTLFGNKFESYLNQAWTDGEKSATTQKNVFLGMLEEEIFNEQNGTLKNNDDDKNIFSAVQFGSR